MNKAVLSKQLNSERIGELKNDTQTLSSFYKIKTMERLFMLWKNWED